MNLPQLPRTLGGVLSWAKQVNDYLRSLTPRSGDGPIRVNWGTSGVTWDVAGRRESGSRRRSGRQIPFTFTAAGVVPTEAEIETGIEAAYSSRSITPAPGDLLYSTAFTYLVYGEKNVDNNTIASSGVWRVTFQVDSVEYVAHGWQNGLY